MDKNIEQIQKNMQTIFKGQVNGKTFDSREAMNQYIGQCISEGTPISDISYSSTTQYKEPGQPTQRRSVVNGRKAIQQAQENVSWITYINTINRRVPQPYDNVIGYVVPFVREDININESNVEYIIKDFKARLNDRMEFLENLVFSQICTWKYDDSQVNQWLELLMSGFTHKLEWSNNRINTIENFLNNCDEFILNHIDATSLRGFYDIYTETSGFCSALIDIITDLQKRMQCECGCGK